MGSRSATLPVTRAGTFSRRAMPVARERNPTGHTRGNVFQTRNAGRAEARNPTGHTLGNVFQTRDAESRGRQPYRSYARERFPDAQRRIARPYHFTASLTLKV